MKREKWKYLSFFLLGLSLGVIIVSTCYHFNEKKEVVSGYSEEDVLQKANELLVKKLREATKNNEVQEDSTSDSKNESTNIEDKSQKNRIEKNEDVKDSNNEQPNDSNDKKEYITFIVKKGESSDSIIARLYEVGIIKDIKEFNKIIHKRNLEKRLMFGEFKISKDEDIDTLLKKLTSD